LCSTYIGRSRLLKLHSPLPPSLNSQSARAHKREKDYTVRNVLFKKLRTFWELNISFFYFLSFSPSLAHGCFSFLKNLTD
jgi:uncharacterized protein (UPF0254 family)